MAIVVVPGITNRALMRGGPTRRVQKPFNRTTTSISGRTGHVTVACEGAFSWARLWFGNTGAAYVIDAATMQSSSTNTTTTPQDAALATRSLLPVYFDGLGLDTRPGSTAQTVTTLTVPVGTAAAPSYACSDWLLVPSVPRNDADWRPYLMARAYTSAAAPWAILTDQVPWNSAPAIHLGRTWEMADGAGNVTTTTTPLAATPRTSIWAIETISETGGRTVLSLGDSITQGNTTTVGNWNWVHIATAQISSAATPVAHVNGGWASQTMTQIHTRALTEIPQYKPNVVIIAPWSPNDANTEADADRSFGRMMSMAQIARDNGAVPILWTAIPRDSHATVGDDLWRRKTNTKIRALAAQGWLVADLDAVIGTGADPGRITPAYTVDGTHINDLGNQVAAGALLPVLRQALRF